jgi:hypothetical protein
VNCPECPGRRLEQSGDGTWMGLCCGIRWVVVSDGRGGMKLVSVAETIRKEPRP